MPRNKIMVQDNSLCYIRLKISELFYCQNVMLQFMCIGKRSPTYSVSVLDYSIISATIRKKNAIVSYCRLTRLDIKQFRYIRKWKQTRQAFVYEMAAIYICEFYVLAMQTTVQWQFIINSKMSLLTLNNISAYLQTRDIESKLCLSPWDLPSFNLGIHVIISTSPTPVWQI